MLLGLIVLLYSAGLYDRTGRPNSKGADCTRRVLLSDIRIRIICSLVAKKSLSDLLVNTRLESSNVEMDQYHLSILSDSQDPTRTPSRHHCWSAART